MKVMIVKEVMIGDVSSVAMLGVLLNILWFFSPQCKLHNYKLPFANLYTSLCPFQYFLVIQSDLKRWCGATPPSGMVLFIPASNSTING